MSKYHLCRKFCEIEDGMTKYYSIRMFGDTYFLEPCGYYTRMPYPLLRFYERAFYHVNGWQPTLVGLSAGSGGDIINEDYAMDLARPAQNVSPDLRDKLKHFCHLCSDVSIRESINLGMQIIRVMSSISDEALALLLLTLADDDAAAEGATCSAIDDWCRWSARRGYPDAFRPGFWAKAPGAGRIYVRFQNQNAKEPMQQCGWKMESFHDVRSQTELVIAISTQVVLALFDNNVMTFAQHLANNIEYQREISEEHKDTIPWRNLVFRVLNDLLPGYWSPCANKSNFTFNVGVTTE